MNSQTNVYAQTAYAEAITAYRILCKLCGYVSVKIENIITEHKNRKSNRSFRRIRIDGKEADVTISAIILLSREVNTSDWNPQTAHVDIFDDGGTLSRIIEIDFEKGLLSLDGFSLQEEFDHMIGLAIEALIKRDISPKQFKFDQIFLYDWSEKYEWWRGKTGRAILAIPRWNDHTLYVAFCLHPRLRVQVVLLHYTETLPTLAHLYRPKRSKK
jgi:hypothetical protein